MCGRITQKTGEPPGFVTVMGDNRDSRVKDPKDWARYNGAPSLDYWVIRKHPKTGENQRDRMTWGLIPYWVKQASGGRKAINAKAETVASLPSFRDAYRRRRCLLPIDNFFEWKAIKGQKAKQPYAIAMRSGEPFALAAIWENWKVPGTEDWLRHSESSPPTPTRWCPRSTTGCQSYSSPKHTTGGWRTSSRTRVTCWCRSLPSRCACGRYRARREQTRER